MPPKVTVPLSPQCIAVTRVHRLNSSARYAQRLSGPQLLDPFLDVGHRLFLHRRRLDLAGAGEGHQFPGLGEGGDHEAGNRFPMLSAPVMRSTVGTF
jgi:hypothetical protein